MRNLKAWSLFLLTLGLAACPALGEQAAKSPDPPSAQHPTKEGASRDKLQEKLILSDATRVNTSEAARRAAARVASSHASPSQAAVDGKTAAAPGVVEFQPVTAEGLAQPDATRDQRDKKVESKAPLKNVHGSVYRALGATDAGNREGAASVGGTSKGGKTAIYVETDHSTSAAPTPR